MKRTTHKRTLRTKITLAYLLIMVLPLLCLSAVFLGEIERNAAEEQRQLLTEYIEQVGRSLDSIVDETTQLGRMHIMRYDILQTMRKDYNKYPDDLVADSRSMADLIGVAVKLNQRIYRMTMVARYGQLFSHFFPPYLEDKEEFNRRISIMNDSGRSIMVFPPVPVIGSEGVQNAAYIPILIEMRDPHTWVKVGYACIDVHYQELASLFSGGNSDKGAHLNILMINDENVIYDSAIPPEEAGRFNSPVGEAVIQALKESGGVPPSIQMRTEEDNAQYELESVENGSTGWRVVVYSSDYNMLPGRFWQRAWQYALIVALLVSLSALVGRKFFGGFMQQVNLLRAAMRAAQDGYIRRLEVKSDTREMQSLYDSYNSMAERITESVKREYEIRLLQKKTEMDMLLLQINPHFLYNTLNLIRSIAQCNNVDEIDRISVCLSGMLRYSLQSAQNVSLDEELQQVYAYITIQQMRFPDTVFTNYTIDPNLRTCRVIKFIIQPIVENSFRHALEKKKGDRRLTIDVSEKKGDLEISISDNGAGMAPPMVEALQTRLNQSAEYAEPGQSELAGGDSDSTRIGLINVHKRLMYSYGPGYGIWLESWLGEGTIVTLRLPVQYE